jgi:hypothetical protein
VSKHLIRRVAGAGATLIVSVFILTTLVTRGSVHAQGSGTAPGNPTILKAIEALQESVNDVQAAVAPRTFYLTSGKSFNGGQASTGCAAGFHLASQWEIVDPSNLRYDTTLGFTQGDSGEGPPGTDSTNVNVGDVDGWARDGLAASNGNCLAYTSSASGVSGFVIHLDVSTRSWSTAPSTASSCSIPRRVWCVED